MSSAPEVHMLDFNDAAFSYDKHMPFIRGVSFSVDNGEFIGLLGANGSGKSTILKLAGGILKASAGEVKLWGKPIASYGNRDRAKLLSYLPQMLDTGIPFTVRELASMGLYPYDIMPGISVEDALEAAGLKEKSGAHISSLSGGEKRRAYIAMTLLQGAGLLLLDEPLANLDIKYQIELIKLLKNLREKRGISLIMALHDINTAMQFDRLIVIKEGRLLGSGRPESVLTKELLKEAFDVEVEIKREDSGGVYIKY
ncbi:MAG: ABC transporter ATP-binding protein [Nitrospirae bacterium]|nr:ABC transporter ATP-binding protein [Nitrospirota bacterium]